MSAVIKNGDPSERGPPRVCRFTARYRFCNEIRYGYKPISDKIFGCTHRKHAVTAAAKAPLEHISGGKPLEGSVVARRAPETVDQAREHREIREFLDGTDAPSLAPPPPRDHSCRSPEAHAHAHAHTHAHAHAGAPTAAADARSAGRSTARS